METSCQNEAKNITFGHSEQNYPLKHQVAIGVMEMKEHSDQNRGVAEDKPRKLKQEL